MQKFSAPNIHRPTYLSSDPKPQPPAVSDAANENAREGTASTEPSLSELRALVAAQATIMHAQAATIEDLKSRVSELERQSVIVANTLKELYRIGSFASSGSNGANGQETEVNAMS